jgi:hypothetical protein
VTVLNRSAPPGKETKYARLEYERKFLLDNPPELGVVRRVEITDLYVSGSRVRLRRAVTVFDEAVGNEAVDATVYKLTQKIPGPNGRPGLLTSFYLDDREYEAFSRLPGESLHKTRLSIPPLAIDCFTGPLEGLCLAEAEFETLADMNAFTAPESVIGEVTEDVRFSGGQLVTTTRDALEKIVAEYGITLSR